MRYFNTLEQIDDNTFEIYDSSRGLKYTFKSFKRFSKSNLRDMFDVCSRQHIEDFIKTFAIIL